MLTNATTTMNGIVDCLVYLNGMYCVECFTNVRGIIQHQNGFLHCCPSIWHPLILCLHMNGVPIFLLVCYYIPFKHFAVAKILTSVGQVPNLPFLYTGCIYNHSFFHFHSKSVHSIFQARSLYNRILFP